MNNKIETDTRRTRVTHMCIIIDPASIAISSSSRARLHARNSTMTTASVNLNKEKKSVFRRQWQTVSTQKEATALAASLIISRRMCEIEPASGVGLVSGCWCTRMHGEGVRGSDGRASIASPFDVVEPMRPRVVVVWCGVGWMGQLRRNIKVGGV